MVAVRSAARSGEDEGLGCQGRVVICDAPTVGEVAGEAEAVGEKVGDFAGFEGVMHGRVAVDPDFINNVAKLFEVAQCLPFSGCNGGFVQHLA